MATMTVFRSLRMMHRRWRLDHVVICTEGGRSWRQSIFPAYKARRRLMTAAKKPSERAEDEVLSKALNDLVDFLHDETRCTVLRGHGLEADDLVAGWIDRHPHARHIILSGDSDFVQLLAPNVTLRDSQNERTVDITGVVNDAGETLSFGLDSTSGRIRVGKPDPTFTPPPEWWRESLFMKIVRGDTTDGIFPAYPGVRFTGSSKRVGIREAWDDREQQGWHWQNFMQHTWDKTRLADDGTTIRTPVRVLDEFRFNERLIDLRKQPPDIRQAMDVAMDAACSLESPARVGMSFIRWCTTHDLPFLAKEAEDHVAYLGKSLPKSP